MANQHAIVQGKRYSAPTVADPSLFLGNKNLPDGWYPDIFVDMMSTNNAFLAVYCRHDVSVDNHIYQLSYSMATDLDYLRSGTAYLHSA